MTEAFTGYPIQITMTAGEQPLEGYVYKITTNAMTICTAKGDTAFGIIDQTLQDDEAVAQTARSGQKVGVFPLGCGRIVMAASAASEILATGAIVYLDGNGRITTTASTSRPIGHYMGDGQTSSSTAGELVKVLLDIQIGAATV